MRIEQLTPAYKITPDMNIPIEILGQNMRITVGQIVDNLTEHSYRMEVDFGGDNFLAWGEEKEVRCRVMQGWRDVSDKVSEWRISRDSGDEAEDAAWGLKPKARDFEGSLVLSLTEEDNDLRQGHALFTICARVEGDKTLTAQIEI